MGVVAPMLVGFSDRLRLVVVHWEQWSRFAAVPVPVLGTALSL